MTGGRFGRAHTLSISTVLVLQYQPEGLGLVDGLLWLMN